MMKVYCDTGAFRKELRDLVNSGKIQIWQFKYENKNKNIKNQASPSNPTWDQMNYSWDEIAISWDDLGKTSEKYDEIKNLIGGNNAVDVKHIDSAYQSGCHAFLTSDKGDICSKREQIYSLLGIKVFHFQDDWIEFQDTANGST